MPIWLFTLVEYKLGKVTMEVLPETVRVQLESLYGPVLSEYLQFLGGELVKL